MIRPLWLLAFSILLALGGTCSQAQLAAGLRSGLVVSDMRFLGADYASTAGFSLGASLNFPMGTRTSVQPELVYVQKGFTVTVPATQANGNIRFDEAEAEVEVALNYLEIPLLLKYDLLESTSARPFALFGLAPAFLLEQSAFTRRGSIPGIAEDFRSFDIGVVLGGGVDWRLDQIVLGLDVRYTVGLINQLDDIRSQNRALQLLGGVSLLLD